MCMALSPCGLMVACATLLGQVYIFAAQPHGGSSSSSFSPDYSAAAAAAATPDQSLVSVPEWQDIKWTQVAVLQDFNDDHVDEFWCIAWTPDSSHIIVAGSCKSRHMFDEVDGDLKVLPSPLIVFDLEACMDPSHSNNISSPSSSKRSPKTGISRYEGHQEEVVDLKLWKVDSNTSNHAPEYIVVTCSQDGHVRKWKFDKTWNRLQATFCLSDEETWMAFAVAHLTIPPSDYVTATSESDLPVTPATLVSYPSLILLAGDGTLKMFDCTMNTKLLTFDGLYDTYCTNVELFTTPYSLEHPWRPGIYLNGDGFVYSNMECTQKCAGEPPTFLVLTRGIDRLTYSGKSTNEGGANRGGSADKFDNDDDDDDDDEDDFDERRMARPGEPNPTRILMHVLTLPLTQSILKAPTVKDGARRVEVTHKYNVEADKVRLETIYTFSHPRFECNYWPGKLTHNGCYIVNVASNGAAFAWNFVKSNVTASYSAASSSPSRSRTSSSSSTAASLKQTSTTSSSSSPTTKPSTLSGYPMSPANVNPTASCAPPHLKPINASSHITAILASHEELALRDVTFHPYWPFVFTAGDDNSVHVWAPTLFDPVKMCSIPLPHVASDAPISASLTSVIVPQGANLAFSQQVSSSLSGSSSVPQQQGTSVYRAAIEAAMMASVGSLLPAVEKRKRGRPPKKKIIEEIEAQFAAQERALAAQHQLHIVNPQPSSDATPLNSAQTVSRHVPSSSDQMQVDNTFQSSTS